MINKLKDIQQRIERASSRSPWPGRDITLVAVSKTVGEEAVSQAAALGVSDFGENRTRDLVMKQQAFPDLGWHMIGRLQSNKVKDIIGRSVLIHSLDRWSLAREIDQRARQQRIIADVLVQVNISGEARKAGLPPQEVRSFLDSIGELPGLRIKGLMTIAPEDSDAEQTRPVFRELYLLRKSLIPQKMVRVELEYLSMGMSQDYEVAIEEGANIVRIGSAIFS